MPRQTGAQTGTFTYNAQQLLASATNPENGTVTYSYNADGTLAFKTDALGQKVAYQHDSFERVIEVDRYAAGAAHPNACDTMTLTCDQPLAGAPYGTYQWTRTRFLRVARS